MARSLCCAALLALATLLPVVLAQVKYPASIPYQDVRIYNGSDAIPPTCLHDPTDPNMLFVNGPDCPAMFPDATITCPSQSEGINFQYFVNNQQIPSPFPEWFISSNTTMIPFSSAPVPIEDISSPTAQPVVPRTCDSSGRCIEAYEIFADVGFNDFGWRNADGSVQLSQVLKYNDMIPGPRFIIDQGVQTLIRLHNNIFCNKTTNQPWDEAAIEAHYHKDITALTLHLHGSTSLSPFDGWTEDFIRPCQWKDYVFPNELGAVPHWYHDHTVGVTMESAGSGLSGSYWVRPSCDDQTLPESLARLGDPIYLMFQDTIFLQYEGSPYMNPHIKNVTAHTLYRSDKPGYRLPLNTGSGGWIGGDHNMVNGRVWPRATVQRKPYFFIFHNSAITRPFHFVLRDAAGNNLNQQDGAFWVIGADGGLRLTPTAAASGLVIATGERYMVVIDFSFFAPGDVLTLNNDPTSVAEVPTYCFSHLVMQFIISGDTPQEAHWNPIYNAGSQLLEDTQMTLDQVQEACSIALTGQADELIQATFNLQFDGPYINGIREQSALGHFTFNYVKDAIYTSPTEWRLSIMGSPGLVPRSLKTEQMMAHQLKGRAERRQLAEARALSADNKGRNLMGRKLKQAYNIWNLGQNTTFGDIHITDTVLPNAMATNGWSVWWLYSPFPAVHPIHIHLTSFYVCGRSNDNELCRPGIDPYACPNYVSNVRNYEMLVPKDIAVLEAFGQVAVVGRYGPHQGKYQWHCHNLIHEDEGLMATFNTSNVNNPNVPGHGNFSAHALDPARFADAWGQSPPSPLLFFGPDPLVKSIPNSYIGQNLANADSMPPWAMRTDASGNPQPITTALLQNVLGRNYYKVFYPDGRKNLTTPVRGNKWAVICNKDNTATAGKK